MEREKKYLKVGDVLYPKNNYGIKSPIVIDRVTKTQAIAGDYKFRIEYYHSAVRIGGPSGYNSINYYLETDELKQELWRNTAIYIASTTNFT